MLNKITLNIITAIFILLFLYSGLSKLFGYKEFVSKIQKSPLLGQIPLWLIWAIPGVELAAVIMLIMRAWRLKGFYVCCLSMVMFTLYIIYISQFTYYIPCSCGGFLDTLPKNGHILLNTALVLLAGLGIYLHKHLAQNLPQNALIKHRRV